MAVQVAEQFERVGGRGVGPHTLDALAQLSSAELEHCFAAGAAVPLGAVTGDPVGRVLAVRGFDAGPLAAVRRWIARTPLILWEGKSFRAEPGADTGFGGNRARLGVRGIVLRFATSEGPSIVDGRPCLRIDYDIASNPRLARRIYDELREVSPGLYLGRGGCVGRHRTHLVLWFAVDAREQAAPIRLDPPQR